MLALVDMRGASSRLYDATGNNGTFPGAFLGDDRCWEAEGVLQYWSLRTWPGYAQLAALEEQPSIVRRLCCSDPLSMKSEDCWRSSYTYQRCCTEAYRMLPLPSVGRCPPGYTAAAGLLAALSCEQSLLAGSCVLGTEAAFRTCDALPKCCGVSEAISGPMRSSLAGALLVGSGPLLPEAEWRTCLKEVQGAVMAPHRSSGSGQGQVAGHDTASSSPMCWASHHIEAFCCRAELRFSDLCKLGKQQDDGATWSACCRARHGGRSTVRRASLPLPAVGKRCWARLWRQEAMSRLVGAAENTTTMMRPVDLGRLALHFYSAGDASPALLIIVQGLRDLMRGGWALEMCPAAAVLAQLLALEQQLHQTQALRIKGRLGNLGLAWRLLKAARSDANETSSVAQASEAGGGPRGRTSFDGSLAAQVQDEVPDVVALADADLLMEAISRGFQRLAAKTAELQQLVRQRVLSGSFGVNLVIPLCWPREGPDLSHLLEKHLQYISALRDVVEVYIYDICHGLFPPGSPADHRNDLELDILAAAEEGGVQHPFSGKMLLPKILVSFARHFRRAYVVPFLEEIEVGDTAVYLHHLARHYHSLPEVVICMSPDAYEHISPGLLASVMRSLAYRMWPQDLSFLYLGHRHNGPVDEDGRVGSELFLRCRRHPQKKKRPSASFFLGGRTLDYLPHATAASSGVNWCTCLEHGWELLFGRPLQPDEDDFGGYDYSQFAVHRSAVLRRPRAFWESAWQALSRRANYELLPGTRHVSWKVDGIPSMSWNKCMSMVLEHIWHVLFHPRARSWLWPTRLRDPSVPLSFKENLLHSNQPRLLRHYSWSWHGRLN